ncbi:iron-containing alcohol dehydrogenase [uncultured Anaerofustis sp.]|uniref:iron-containing alcohol dehydrogenase n=1 Tax=uncultured Anaerofustis sp. TaxID=904996 RepID=UPI0025E6C197|nr:iron-containing alcohol dehydrogenase [uncultured Anaerofustis sp.]
MNNFNFYLPTNVYFGKGQIKHLPKVLKECGNKVLLVYGGGSIKRSGLYDEIMNLCNENNIEVFELSGVDPNPRIESVRDGSKICKENDIDVVLAAGGGSSIDCAKMIAAAAKSDLDAWELVIDPNKIKDTLPIVSILTLAATGSEMDPFAVISDMNANMKAGVGCDLLKPKASIMDPSYTFSVPKKQTAAGTADIMSHIFESYFSNVKEGFMQSRIAEALLKTCIKYGPIAYNDPENYEARANLMWASSWAINGLLKAGNEVEWCVHPMEHELSAYYDITHGVGLAILTPRWMEYVLSEDTLDRFVEYGMNVWGISPHKEKEEIAKEAIENTYKFFESLDIPMTLKEVGIDETHLEKMASKIDKIETAYKPLYKEDMLKIYKMSL